jgi:hypothetical protein
MVAAIAAGLVTVAPAFGRLIGTWDSQDRMAVPAAEARIAPVAAASPPLRRSDETGNLRRHSSAECVSL